MKKGFVILVAAITTFIIAIGCEKNEIKKDIVEKDETENETENETEKNIVDSKGLSLYWWNHQVFSEQGRGYIFGFSEVERLDVFYELIFEYQIDNNQKIIEISLVDKIDKGKCPYFPTPDKDASLCTSTGKFYIPEDMVSEGKYKFIVKTLNFTVQSEIVFTKEKATLNVPDNNNFTCAFNDVFIAPKNLVHGSIVFAGEQNKIFALNFIDDLRSLGLRDTIVTNPPLIKVDETGNPITETWEPNNYSIPFLLTMTSDFSIIFELAKVHFNKNSALNIYLFSTNGDQARADFQGVEVWYAK